MPAGTWTPLAWDASANRYAIDVWQDIAVNRETLWIATPAGLVSRDGNWSFNPDTFRVVLGVPAEAGGKATDLRVDGNAAYVRYDGARAYRVAHRRTSASARRVRLDRRSLRRADVRHRRQVLDMAHHRTNRRQRRTALRHVEGRADRGRQRAVRLRRGQFDGGLPRAAPRRHEHARLVRAARRFGGARSPVAAESPVHSSAGRREAVCQPRPRRAGAVSPGRRWTVRSALAERRHPANARLPRPRRA